MALEDIKRVKEIVNLRVLAGALIGAIAGVGFLYWSALKGYWVGNEAWQTVVRDIGGLMVVTVAITLLWELAGKRALLDEVLAKAQISKEISFAGITKITDSFHHDIDWTSYFRSVNKLDIFFAYGRTWRNTHFDELQSVAAREDSRIRVVLPDPEDEQTMLELSRRFNYTSGKLDALIREAESFFRNLRPPTGTNGAQIDIWFLPATPLFSFYRFDRIAILALYTHRGERVPIPTIVCEMGGTLYDYIRKEFDAMIRSDGLARLVT